MRILSLLFIVTCLFFISCKSQVGLEPVSGVEGKISFVGNWPVDVKAVTIVALDSLDLNNLGDHFVAYSNPIDSGAVESDYFMQLIPNQYYLAVIGITIKPSKFAANIDAYLSSESIPIIPLDSDLQSLKTGVIVNYQEITIENRIIFY